MHGRGVLSLFGAAHPVRSVLCVLWLLLASLSACRQLAPPPDSAAEPRGDAIYVLRGGWHTELALPVSLVGDNLASALQPDFPGARFLVFGWGASDYYMAPDPGLAEAMRALSPGPAVMLVMGLSA